MFWFLATRCCGILAPQPGIEPASPTLEGELSTTGLPGSPWLFRLLSCVFCTKSLQLCLTLCNPTDSGLPGFSQPHRRWPARLLSTPQTVAHQASLSMGFFRQEYRSGLPCPPPGDLSDLGTEPLPLVSPALVRGFFFFFFNNRIWRSQDGGGTGKGDHFLSYKFIEKTTER